MLRPAASCRATRRRCNGCSRCETADAMDPQMSFEPLTPTSGLRRVDAPSEYEALLDRAAPLSVPVQDERGLIALNYTSGTTARPKGVMYHHRGAFLISLAMAMQLKLDSDSRFLWTVPMFHCN